MLSLPQVFGRYRLLAPLSGDAGTEVFRGALPGLGGYEKPVVIRRLRADDARQDAAVERFFARAQAAASIQHPNAVPVFEIGTGPQGQPFMVEGWVSGPSLQALMRRVRGADQQLPTWFTLHVANEVLAALVHGADKGVAHGALKAEQVRLSYDGEIRLTGFGQRAAADDPAAVRALICDDMALSIDAPDLPASLRPWLAGDVNGDLTACLGWVQDGLDRLKVRRTLVDVAGALASIEAAVHGWPKSATFDATPVRLEAENASVPVHRGIPRTEWRAAAAVPHEDALGRVPHEDALGRVPHEDALGRVPHEDALGRVPHEDALGRVPHEDALGRVPHEAHGDGRSIEGPSTVPDAPVVDEFRAVALASEALTDPVPRPSTSLPAWDDFAESEPTDPSRPPVELSPTVEIRPGRRGDVRLWLEVPPAVVGPRRLQEGLRLIRELGAMREGLSLSVDGQLFCALTRVAQQLGEALPDPGPLDPEAPVQGMLTDRSALQIIADRAQVRATGRLTFARHEPDAPERVSFEFVEGNLVGAMASTAPLAAWSRMLSDPDLPVGMAVRAFAVVVSEDLPIAEVGSPLLLAALMNARAEQAQQQLDDVMGWTWARYAFVPGSPTPLSDRVTDLPVLPRVLQWMFAPTQEAIVLARLVPHLDCPMERSDDFDEVLSRLRAAPSLLSFASQLGHGGTPRDALTHVDVQDDAKARALISLLVDLSVLTPA